MSKAQLLTTIFESLNTQNISFCVLRSYEDLPQNVANDVDFVVQEKDFKKAEACIRAIANDAQWHVWRKPAEFDDLHLIMQKRGKNEIETLSIDIKPHVPDRGVVYISGAQALAHKRSYKKFFILSREHELIHMLAHGAYGSQTSRAAYVRKIAELVENVTTISITDSPWTNKTTKQVQAYLDKKQYDAALRFVQKNFTSFLFKNKTAILHSVRFVMKQISRVIRRVYPPGRFVVLAGPDGVGKSTAAKNVHTILSQRYIGTKHMHLGFRPQALPARKKKRTPRQRRNPIVEFARFAYHSVDYIISYWTDVRPILVKRGVVIAERYFYDYLIRMNRKGVRIPRFIAEITFRALIPKPDAVVLLKADAQTIMARRDDLQEEAIEKQIAALEKLGAKSNAFLCVDTTESPDHVAFTIADWICHE